MDTESNALLDNYYEKQRVRMAAMSTLDKASNAHHEARTAFELANDNVEAALALLTAHIREVAAEFPKTV